MRTRDGEVDHRSSLTLVGDNVLDRPVEAHHNIGQRTGRLLHDLDRKQPTLLSHAICPAADYPGDFSAMAAGVSPSTFLPNQVCVECPALKILVFYINSRVNHICICAQSRARIVRVTFVFVP